MMLTVDELKKRFVVVKLKGVEKYRIRDKKSGDFLLGFLGVPLELNDPGRLTEMRDRSVMQLFEEQPDAWEKVK